MKAQQVRYDQDADAIDSPEDQAPEDWVEVCDRYDNDVQRVRDVQDRPPFTALYACYDPDNRPVYFLVEEDRGLDRLRHKVFFSKLGRED
jgi:hypothetical protein